MTKYSLKPQSYSTVNDKENQKQFTYLDYVAHNDKGEAIAKLDVIQMLLLINLIGIAPHIPDPPWLVNKWQCLAIGMYPQKEQHRDFIQQRVWAVELPE
jgi:hypothetical protein